MMTYLALAILIMQPAGQWKADCESPQTQREIDICTYLKFLEKFEIKKVEIVAVGTHEEMISLRSVARGCGLVNHIDPIDKDRSMFQIINSTKNSKKCILKWIKRETPNLEWTEQKEMEFEGFIR
jgi:hypothetical protein